MAMSCHERRRTGLLLLAIPLVFATFFAAGPAAAADRPNVLLYVVDSLRPDSLGAYGNDVVKTPNFDRIAREGRLYTDAFAPSSWTRASVASLFTGLYPDANGVIGRGDPLSDEAKTLAELLQSNGYATAFVNGNPNVASFFGFGQGFDLMREMYRRRRRGKVRIHELIAPSDEIGRVALEWVEEAKRPFFLTVLSIDVREPYTPPESFDTYADWYKGSANGGFPTLRRDRITRADRRRVRSLYDAEVTFNDSSFGVLIDALEARKELDRTVVVLTSSHGTEFWEYSGRRGSGLSLNDHAIRVPLIVRYPGSRAVGRGVRSDVPVQLTDVLPTVTALTGVKTPKGLDGRSLLGRRDGSPVRVFGELRHGRQDLVAVRAHPWKLVSDGATGSATLYDLTDEEGERPVRTSRNPGEEVVDSLMAEVRRYRAQEVRPWRPWSSS